MKTLKVIIISFTFLNAASGQNFPGGKIMSGFHFNSKNSHHKKFEPGFILSVFVEPRVSNSGNLVFNFDYGRFKISDSTTYFSSGLYSILAGYKQKFFYGKSDVYLSGTVGALFGGIGFKFSLGNELVISRSVFLSADLFYGAGITSATGDGGSNKPVSVFGLTAGIGLTH